MSGNTNFSVAQFLIYALLASEKRSVPQIAELAKDYVSSSHAHKLVNDAVAASEAKHSGFDNSRPGPPARVFTLTATGRKVLAGHRRRLKFLLPPVPVKAAVEAPAAKKVAKKRKASKA